MLSSTACQVIQLHGSPLVAHRLSAVTTMAAAKVKLSSSDAQLFEVDEEVAFESQTIKSIVEDAGTEDAIPLPNVSGKILAKVIEFSKYHVEAKSSTEPAKPAKTEDEVKAWDADFVRVDQATLFDLILVRLMHVLRMTQKPIGASHLHPTMDIPIPQAV